MEGDGIQQAFCALLWRANGGQLDEKGQPIRVAVSDVRGTCTRAYDCATCDLMVHELSMHPPGTATWACPDCASALKSRRDGRGLHLLLPGYYTEGYCQVPFCSREAEAKWSPLLQLVIGDITKE